MLKIKEIREKTDAELRVLIDELRRENYQLRVQGRTGELKNTARPRQIKREIARILTEQQSRTTVQG